MSFSWTTVANSLSNAKISCLQFYPSRVSINLDQNALSSEIGSIVWKRQMARVLGKLNRTRSSRWTENDKYFLKSLGLLDYELKSSSWKQVRERILERINSLAEQNQEVKLAKEEYQKQLVGMVAALAPISSPPPSPESRSDSAAHSVDTGFGVLILPPNDKAYQDPEYLMKTIGNRGATSTGYTRHDPQKTYEFFSQQFKRWTEGYDHEIVPVAFTQGASDANSLLVDVANWIVSIRNKKRMQGRILVFDESYVAARGPLRHLRFFDRVDTGILPAPIEISREFWKDEVVPYRANKGAIEEVDLFERDFKALEWIENQFKKGDVGVFLVEPITSAAYIKFHKPAMLKALSELGKKYGVAIVADEAFGSGGRTGLPFSYMHYQNFIPDFIVFGKGMITAGLAEVVRKEGQNTFLIEKLEKEIQSNWDKYSLNENGQNYKMFDPTINGWSDIFLKSAVTIKRILDDNLMENAKLMGEKLKREVQWLVHVFGAFPSWSKPMYKAGLTSDEREQVFQKLISQSPNAVRSIGLMIGFESSVGQIRLTPPITFGDKELKEFVKRTILDTLLEADRKYNGGSHFIEIEELRHLEGEKLKTASMILRWKYFENYGGILPNILGRISLSN